METNREKLLKAKFLRNLRRRAEKSQSALWVLTEINAGRVVMDVDPDYDLVALDTSGTLAR
jgi:hypothetical protein